MKNFINVSFLSFLFFTSKGQDTIKHFELGSTLITVNTFDKPNYFLEDKSPVEIFNAIFFRYTLKRIGLRSSIGYSEFQKSYSESAQKASSNYKDFMIGAGGQYTILKKNELLYTFIELTYTNRYSTGSYMGGVGSWNSKFSSTENRVGAFIGFGFKIKLTRNVLISPEIAFPNAFLDWERGSVTDLTSGQANSYNGVNFEKLSGSLKLKLHLTIKF